MAHLYCCVHVSFASLQNYEVQAVLYTAFSDLVWDVLVQKLNMIAI